MANFPGPAQLEQLGNLLHQPLAQADQYALWDANTYTLGFDSDAFAVELAINDWIESTGDSDSESTEKPLPIFHNDSSQQSTMEWHSRHLYVHYLHLRHAFVFFRYYLLTSVPYFPMLGDWYDPLLQKRISAEKSWQLARVYFEGRYNMELETSWVDGMGNRQEVNNAILFETVCLHTSPEKTSPDSIQWRLKRRHLRLTVLG